MMDELMAAIFWHGMWESKKHEMPILIEPSETALVWLQRNTNWTEYVVLSDEFD